MNKPIIGIVSKHYDDSDSIRSNTFIRDEVKQAIFDNGGIAIGILPTESKINYTQDAWKDTLSNIEKENLINQIKLCDGIILQGGAQSDTYEIIIAKYCYDNDIPILGICAGQNNIVRALNGTTCMINNPEDHNKATKEYVHNLLINENSLFYNIVKTNKMMVNSRHNRTIKNCPMLDKVAFCTDGYPDVVESKEKKFYIGVRFHPESLYIKDKNHNKIFTSFINSCKK
ncbi:MAG: gamma-glutamyl-gamma-aminobutyrate hydrolase family protein [Clostridia bacterium]